MIHARDRVPDCLWANDLQHCGITYAKLPHQGPRLGTMSRTSRPPSWIGADIEEQAFSSQFDEIRRLELREGTAQSQSAFTAQLADVRYVEWRGGRSNDQDDDMYWLAHPQRSDSDNVQGLDSEERPQIEQELTLNDREKARAVYKHNVENYWSLFQQASTMPRNGFIGLRQNRSQHQLRCTSCLGMIPARPQEYFIPWEPPEPDGFVYNIHLNPCFTKLYLGEPSPPRLSQVYR